MTRPSPDTTHLVLRQMPHGGWIIADHTGELAAFSTIGELCNWLEASYREPASEQDDVSDLRLLHSPAQNVTLLERVGITSSRK